MFSNKLVYENYYRYT